MDSIGTGTLDRVQFTVFLDKPRICLRCGEQFKLRDNLGTLECRKLHALELRTDGHSYPCCDRRPDADGCVPADHVDCLDIRTLRRSFRHANTRLLKPEEFAMLALSIAECHRYVRTPTWRLDPDTGTWTVDRVDFATFEERRNLLTKSNAPPRYEYVRWRPDEDWSWGLNKR